MGHFYVLIFHCHNVNNNNILSDEEKKNVFSLMEELCEPGCLFSEHSQSFSHRFLTSQYNLSQCINYGLSFICIYPSISFLQFTNRYTCTRRSRFKQLTFSIGNFKRDFVSLLELFLKERNDCEVASSFSAKKITPMFFCKLYLCRQIM